MKRHTTEAQKVVDGKVVWSGEVLDGEGAIAQRDCAFWEECILEVWRMKL